VSKVTDGDRVGRSRSSARSGRNNDGLGELSRGWSGLVTRGEDRDNEGTGSFIGGFVVLGSKE